MSQTSLSFRPSLVPATPAPVASLIIVEAGYRARSRAVVGVQDPEAAAEAARHAAEEARLDKELCAAILAEEARLAAKAEAAKAAQAAHDAALAARARAEREARREAAAAAKADRAACLAATARGAAFRAEHGSLERTEYSVRGSTVFRGAKDGSLWILAGGGTPVAAAKDGRPIGAFDPAAAARAPWTAPGGRTNVPGLGPSKGQSPSASNGRGQGSKGKK